MFDLSIPSNLQYSLFSLAAMLLGRGMESDHSNDDWLTRPLFATGLEPSAEPSGECTSFRCAFARHSFELQAPL